MPNHSLCCSAAATALVLSLSLVALAQQAPEPPPAPIPNPLPKPAAQPATPEPPDADIDAWLKLAETGPEHALLQRFVGTWDCRVKEWLVPGADATTSTAVLTVSPVLGGRFIRQEFVGSAMGRPFTALGYWGFDNAQAKYTSTWMSTMSTDIQPSVGTYDESTRTFTMTSSGDHAGTAWTSRELTRLVNDETHTFEMFQSHDGGPEVKVLEYTATRRKK